MRTISQDPFINSIPEARPELFSSIMRADQRVVHIKLPPKGNELIGRMATPRKSGRHETYSSLTNEKRPHHMTAAKKTLDAARKMAIVLLLSTLIQPADAQTATNSYTLDDAVRIGLKRSIVVANAARQREIAEVTRKRAISQALPKLTGTANYTTFDPDNISGTESKGVGAEASWEIYSGGRTWSAIRAAKSYRLLTAYQERRTMETQARDIALAYYQVKLAEEQVSALGQSVKQLADFEAETKMKYDAGAVSEFAWLSAKVSLANDKPRLIAARNELALALENFRNLTFIDDEKIVLSDALDFQPAKVNLDAAIALGLKKRPELLESTSMIELRREDIKQQRSDYMPNVSLFANYDYSKPDPYGFYVGQTGWADHWNAGARANWTLFDGGARHANVAESKLNLAIAEDERRDLERYVSLDVRSAWLRGRDAAEVIEATTETVDLAGRALKIARARFDAGLSTNLEVTQANVELSDARLARSQALYQHMVAITQMKHAAGVLLEEYGYE